MRRSVCSTLSLTLMASLRKATIMLLSIAVFLTYSTPLSAQTTQPTEEELTAQFEAELLAYAATHTDSEVVAYAQARVYQIASQAPAGTVQASAEVINPLSLVISEEVLSPTGVTNMLIFTDPEGEEGYDPYRLRLCLDTRAKECQQQYDAALLESAATTTTLVAGCGALSAGQALVVCLAGALTVHFLNIAAASRKNQACLTRAYSDCQLAYGGTRK
jgi:hypothetical protein